MSPKPLVEFQPDSPVPAYRQIADCLRQHLVNGRLNPGDLLPPIRQLAVDLGVHFNTVALAYRALAQEGWLDLKRRRGAMVVDRDKPVARDERRVELILRRLRDLTVELRSEGLSAREIGRELRRLMPGVKP